MKQKITSFIMLVAFTFSNTWVTAQEIQQVRNTLITYTECSNGLASPSWEGGRTELEFADMNGDGNIDIITIGDHGNPGIQSGEEGLMVYFGDGAGNWAVQMNGNFGYGGIAAGDVNNDGLMDVGYAMHHDYSSTDFGDQLIEVALGDGTGMNWTPWDDGLATNGEEYGMFATDFADVDNDGDLDLGSISFGCCSGIHIYLNNMDGTWTQSFGFNAGNSDMIFQFGDINNDGKPDFIAGHQNGTAYFGDGTGQFNLNDAGLPDAGSIGRYGPSLGDINNDGYLDLAFTGYSGGVFVYTWNELLQRWDDWSGNLPASGTMEMTQLADMDMDGYVDLAVFGRGTFRLFLGDGAGNWTADATFTIGMPGYSKAFRVGGDVDHNGRPDIVLVEEEGTWISYKNYLRCFRENSIPYSLSIQAVFPRGHELLRPGSVRFIDWISAVPLDEPTSEVSLEYSTTGPDGPWTLIAAALPDNGRFQWIVPQVNSSDCFIRYTVTAGIMTQSAISPAAFTITDGTIGVKENKRESAGLSVYPNPASDQLTVNSWHTSSITISDLYGRQLKALENISSFPFRIDISDLQPGMYLLHMADKEGLTGSVKFLKIAE